MSIKDSLIQALGRQMQYKNFDKVMEKF